MRIRQFAVSKRVLDQEKFPLEIALKGAGFDLSRSYYRSFDPEHKEYIYEQKADAE